MADTTAAQLIDVLADQAAELDEIVDIHINEYAARTRELIGTPSERDAELWDRLDADLDLTLMDFSLIPRQERGDDWAARFGLLILAARMQAYAEIVLRSVLAIAEAHGNASMPIAEGMTLEGARAAARLGISEDALAVAVRRRLAAKGQAEATDAEAEMTDG